MNGIEEAILRTVLYADVFNFPMTLPELHHFLISPASYTKQQIAHALQTSHRLRNVICQHGEYLVCAGREAIIETRQRREQASNMLFPKAERYAAWLARMPFVRMVAITGALSMRNPADHEDDLDYVVVTAESRVWTARAFAVLLVRLAKFRGVVICPNYVLSETALAQSRHDIFMAHEVAQMIPVYGRGMYSAMRSANEWVVDHMPNADAPYHDFTEYRESGGWRVLKQGLELVLRSPVGEWLENWEHRRKARRFSSEMNRPDHAAQIDRQHVKGHFNDHGHPVLKKYHDRLREHGIDVEMRSLPMAGD